MAQQILHVWATDRTKNTLKGIQVRKKLLLMCETNDHLLQYPKQQRHQNKIMQAVNRLGKEMDPRLQDILHNGLLKYLNGEKQTAYKTPGTKSYQ